MRVLKFIASGLLGAAAFQGGAAIAALGLALHFVIALGAAAVYWAASRRIAFLATHPVPSGLLYGVAVYFFMNLVVIPLSAVPPRPFVLSPAMESSSTCSAWGCPSRWSCGISKGALDEKPMNESNFAISTRRLILAPAMITLAVTLLRLVGELNHWSPALFNREAGGGGALIGIVWLVPIFGVYFALRLLRAGRARPAEAGPSSRRSRAWRCSRCSWRGPSARCRRWAGG